MTTAAVLLAGRPNSGKSTLFNFLSGGNQKVGNFAGCTVEKKTARLTFAEGAFDLIDLPGLVSIKPNSIDESVALREIESAAGDSTILCVVDGNNIRAELSLPLILKNRGYEVVIAVNMMDEVAANKVILNLAGMTELSGLPFFGISARTGEGVEALRRYLENNTKEKAAREATERHSLQDLPAKDAIGVLAKAQKFATQIVDEFVREPEVTKPLIKRNEKIDAVVTHPIAGPAIFVSIMFVVFQSVYTWAGPFTDAIDEFFGWLAEAAATMIPVPWLASLVGDGLIAGVGAVLVFIPQIAILFFLLGLLELSGYLPRAAFIVDRLMKPFGLDGKSVIPLLSSLACAVPGVMAARSIDNPRSRLLSILVAPLMTCSARLPVYTILIAAFVPATTVGGFSLQGITMASLYLLGLAGALLIAGALKYLGSDSNDQKIHFIYLPNYRFPDPRALFRFVWSRVWMFTRKAGTIIASMAILLWFLLSYPVDSGFVAQKEAEIGALASSGLTAEQIAEKQTLIEQEMASYSLANSYGGRLGKALEPLLAPIGYDWKLSIGIVASLAAREVFVATLGTVFALGEVDEESESLLTHLRTAKAADGSPAYGLATCLSLLVFFAFALQCVSTIGIVKKETNSWKIPIAMFLFLFAFAYAGAFVAYRIGLLLQA